MDICTDDVSTTNCEHDTTSAPVKQKKSRKKKGKDAPAASPPLGDLLAQLMSLKEQRDHEQSRAEQEKKDKQRDTLSQKRCGFFFCGPSNTVRAWAG